MQLINKKCKSQVRLTLGIAVITAAGLFGTYQNFDKVCGTDGCRNTASVSNEDEGMAEENVTLSDTHTTLPSLVERIVAVEDFQLHGLGAQEVMKNKKDFSELESMAAIALPASYMKSMGVVPGQRLEVEVNGSVKPVYAYTTASADEKGVDVSLSAAKELGAKVGDKIIIRQLSEAPPQISEK